VSFGDRLRKRREELNLSRTDLAGALGVSRSAIGNYETGVSFPKEDIMLRLFDCLRVDPNYLYCDSFHNPGQVLSHNERNLLEKYRSLPSAGRETVRSVVDALCAYRDEVEQSRPEQEERVIPLYRSPAAAGYAAPVCGEDFDYIPVKDGVPPGAEFAVRIQGDSMEPWIQDDSNVYVNRDPLRAGDVGIFCVDGDMVCKQYYRDPAGTVYLFSLNRKRAEADVVLASGSERSLACFGRVILPKVPPLPGKF
jgi:Predicted transcriptional regulator